MTFLHDKLSKHWRWSARLLIAFLLVLAAYQSSQLIYLIISAPEKTSITLGNKDSLSTVTAPENIQPVIELNLLGRPPVVRNWPEGEPRFQVRTPLPDDQLLLQAPLAKVNVRIVGIVSSRNPHKAMVIIEENNQQNSHVIGDKIGNQQYEVVRILTDRIIINENGYYAALVMN